MYIHQTILTGILLKFGDFLLNQSLLRFRHQDLIQLIRQFLHVKFVSQSIETEIAYGFVRLVECDRSLVVHFNF